MRGRFWRLDPFIVNCNSTLVKQELKVENFIIFCFSHKSQFPHEWTACSRNSYFFGNATQSPGELGSKGRPLSFKVFAFENNVTSIYKIKFLIYPHDWTFSDLRYLSLWSIPWFIIWFGQKICSPLNRNTKAWAIDGFILRITAVLHLFLKDCSITRVFGARSRRLASMALFIQS